MTPYQSRLNTERADYIEAFMERYAPCYGTRDDALDRADELEAIGYNLGALIVKHKLNADDADFMICSQSAIEKDERALVLVACELSVEEGA